MRWQLATAVVASSMGLGGATAFAASSASSSSSEPARVLEAWLQPALENPAARLVVERLEAPPAGCRPAWSKLGNDETDPTLGLRQPLRQSGRVALRVPGDDGGRECQAWIWARVRLYAPVPVTVRSLSAGVSLAGAWKMEERELRTATPVWNPADGAAQADRSLPAGQVIGAEMVRRAGLIPGQPVKVLLLSGALLLEETGTAVPCGRLKACAVLPSGRHLEGSWEEGRLVVRAP